MTRIMEKTQVIYVFRNGPVRVPDFSPPILKPMGTTLKDTTERSSLFETEFDGSSASNVSLDSFIFVPKYSSHFIAQSPPCTILAPDGNFDFLSHWPEIQDRLSEAYKDLAVKPAPKYSREHDRLVGTMDITDLVAILTVPIVEQFTSPVRNRF